MKVFGEGDIAFAVLLIDHACLKVMFELASCA